MRHLGRRPAQQPRGVLAAGDLDGDGLPDLTAATAGRLVSVILNRGPHGLALPVSYNSGIGPSGHRLADLDLDGALDLVIFNVTEAMVLFGRPAPAPPGFVRGDSNGDRAVDLSDPVEILGAERLRGGPHARRSPGVRLNA